MKRKAVALLMACLLTGCTFAPLSETNSADTAAETEVETESQEKKEEKVYLSLL